MFSTFGLFSSVPCPDKLNCKRVQCLFSHAPQATQPRLPYIPTSLETPVASVPIPITKASSSVVPSKRALGSPISTGTLHSRGGGSPVKEPPQKLPKLSQATPVKAIPSPASRGRSSAGAPLIAINAAHSQVAIPVRQAMLDKIYEQFKALYAQNIKDHADLAAQHALEQEQELYAQSTKLTYRNAAISCVANIKKREIPNNLMHDSVGTESAIQKRKEQRQSLRYLRLTRDNLQSRVHLESDLKRLGYITEIPPGDGGTKPGEEGNIKPCDRCGKDFVVERNTGPTSQECTFHWGRPYVTRINGERIRVYKCCSRIEGEGEGCDRGPHVFLETDAQVLHLRHAFSKTRSPYEGLKETALDVVALDCEMIYTTGGSRVARVSVVDGMGDEVFDELVKMDEGVEVLDFNTRFSGITRESYDKGAIRSLSSIRRSLDMLINSDTIIIGHALENDLKTLRLIHHNCVDTAILFPHRAGLPYRRALRDLAREHLNEVIQSGGGDTGHSSVEDSIATLNLVRWFLLNSGKSLPASGAYSKSATDTKAV